jgi:hypothetical protein
MYLDMRQADADRYSAMRGTDEGGKMKETSTTHWRTPNTGDNNESRFFRVARRILQPHNW